MGVGTSDGKRREKKRMEGEHKGKCTDTHGAIVGFEVDRSETVARDEVVFQCRFPVHQRIYLLDKHKGEAIGEGQETEPVLGSG